MAVVVVVKLLIAVRMVFGFGVTVTSRGTSHNIIQERVSHDRFERMLNHYHLTIVTARAHRADPKIAESS